MKHFRLLGITAVMALAMAACGGNAEAEQAEKEAKTLDSLTTQLDSSVNKIKAQSEDLQSALNELGVDSAAH